MDVNGKPTGDHTAKLLDMKMNPSLLPPNVTLRDFGASDSDGQNKYMLNLYLRERGDARIKSNADLIANSNFHEDPTFPDRKKARENVEKVMEYNMAERLLRRFSVQQVILQCMAEQNLNALVYPTSNLPPRKLGAPGGPPINGRRGDGVWSFLGAQGFPVITVPAGFTTETYDLIRDPDSAADAGVSLGNAAAVEAMGASPVMTARGSSAPSRRNCLWGWISSGRPFDEPHYSADRGGVYRCDGASPRARRFRTAARRTLNLLTTSATSPPAEVALTTATTAALEMQAGHMTSLRYKGLV